MISPVSLVFADGRLMHGQLLSDTFLGLLALLKIVLAGYLYLLAALVLLFLLVGAIRPSSALRRAFARLYSALEQHQKRVELLASGCYLPPPPGKSANRFIQRLAWLITTVQVGKIEWRGLENLQFDGPKLITPNHVIYADAAVIVRTLPRPARFMAAARVMRTACGLLGRIAEVCGGFAVDSRKASQARRMAVDVLVSEQDLVIFPEGRCNLDGAMSPFKNGAVRIARAAAKELGRPVYIIPVGIKYGRTAAPWLCNWDVDLAFLFLLLNIWYYRRGAVVTVARPVSTDELPVNDAEASSYLRQRVELALAD